MKELKNKELEQVNGGERRPDKGGAYDPNVLETVGEELNTLTPHASGDDVC